LSRVGASGDCLPPLSDASNPQCRGGVRFETCLLSLWGGGGPGGGKDRWVLLRWGGGVGVWVGFWARGGGGGSRGRISSLGCSQLVRGCCGCGWIKAAVVLAVCVRVRGSSRVRCPINVIGGAGGERYMYICSALVVGKSKSKNEE